MSQWKNVDSAAGAPKFPPAAGYGISANGSTLYGNTQVGAFKSNMDVGVFGVDSVEAGISSGEGKKVAHAGWNLRKVGTGPVTTITIDDGGDGYSNDFITFTPADGNGAGANASYTVDANGVIVSITLNDPGAGYTSAPAVEPDGSTSGNAAILTAVVGGRAGRVQYETLVAMGSMTSDGSDDTLFPDA